MSEQGKVTKSEGKHPQDWCRKVPGYGKNPDEESCDIFLKIIFLLSTSDTVGDKEF